jgi:mRNA-degrading endonuclease toxin of MazEF toxin-antitoxin module
MSSTTTTAVETADKQLDAAARIEEAIALVEKVAKATRLQGVSVESRQNGKRPVIVLSDDDGTRLLAYVSPITRGEHAGGFALEIADYGKYRRESVADVAAAAKAVKTSQRVKPKAKPAPKAKAAVVETPDATVADAPAKDATKTSGKDAS